VEIGRNVGADYAVQGTVSRFGSYLTLTVEAYETMSGKLISSVTANSKTVDGFLGVMDTDTAPLFEAILQNGGRVGESIDPKVGGKPLLAWNHWVGIGLDVLGAAALAFGVYQNSLASSHYDAYLKDTEQDQMDGDFKAYEDAKTLRNVGYIAGGVLLAGGLTFHFAF
jgi:hypothetical protein